MGPLPVIDSPVHPARGALAAGYSIVPVKNTRSKVDRVPLIKWKPYASRRPTAAELHRWERSFPDCNYAIVTGLVSGGIVVLDIDSQEALDWLRAQGALPATYTVWRGMPGRCHLWFRSDRPLCNVKLGPQGAVEVKAHHMLIPLPGSLHWSGQPYTVLNDLPIAELPDWLATLAQPYPVRLPPRKRTPKLTATTAVEAYTQSVVDAVLADLRRTVAGRNHALNKAAFLLGQLVGGGHLNAATAERELEAAAAANGYLAKDGLTVAKHTWQSGLRSGIRQPRDLAQELKDKRKRRARAGQGTDTPLDGAPARTISEAFSGAPICLKASVTALHEMPQHNVQWPNGVPDGVRSAALYVHLGKPLLVYELLTEAIRAELVTSELAFTVADVMTINERLGARLSERTIRDGLKAGVDCFFAESDPLKESESILSSQPAKNPIPCGRRAQSYRLLPSSDIKASLEPRLHAEAIFRRFRSGGIPRLNPSELTALLVDFLACADEQVRDLAAKLAPHFVEAATQQDEVVAQRQLRLARRDIRELRAVLKDTYSTPLPSDWQNVAQYRAVYRRARFDRDPLARVSKSETARLYGVSPSGVNQLNARAGLRNKPPETVVVEIPAEYDDLNDVVRTLEKQNRGRCLYLTISESPDLAPRRFSLHKHSVEQLTHAHYLAHVDDAVLEALHQGFTVQAHIQIASQQEVIPDDAQHPHRSPGCAIEKRPQATPPHRMPMGRAAWFEGVLMQLIAACSAPKAVVAQPVRCSLSTVHPGALAVAL